MLRMRCHERKMGENDASILLAYELGRRVLVSAVHQFEIYFIEFQRDQQPLPSTLFLGRGDLLFDFLHEVDLGDSWLLTKTAGKAG